MSDPFQQPPTQPVYSNPASTPDYLSDSASLPVPGPPPGSQRSRGKMAGALVGVVALVGAGTFAVAQISSNDSDGGGASPKEVGDKFVAALAGEDLLGTIDLLLPGERETFRQPMIDLSEELGRLEVTDDAVDLNKVPGFDITIEDPEVSVTDTNVEDITDITVTGAASVTVNGEDVPIGKLLIDRIFDGDRPDIDSTETSGDFDATFATVKQGGRWYLSVFYTLADKARGDQDIPENGVEPQGAESPEGALENMITSIGDLDLEGIIAGLNPNETAALQRYAPLFIDQGQQQLDDLDASIDIGTTEFSVSGSGNTRQVAVTTLEFTASANGTDVDFSLSNGCITASTTGGEDFKTCAGDDEMDSSLDGYLDDLGMSTTPEFTALIKDVRSSFSDFEMRGIVVDKVDGKWFVSPIGTGSELFLSLLRALDRDEIDTIINDGRAAFNSLVGSFDTSVFDDGGSGDSGSSGSSGDSLAWYDCLDNTEQDSAATCLQDGIANGDFQADEVPAPYQYPECGLFDYYSSGDIYGDSSEDFHAKVDPATQCIVEAAAQDDLDLLYTSPEFARPDCYTSVNPYFYDGTNDDEISAAVQCAYE